MAIVKTQRSEILFFLAASFLQSFFLWFLTIFVSKKFGSLALGEFTFIMAILTPLSVLSSLQLRSYIVSLGKIELFGIAKFLRVSLLPAAYLVGGIFITIYYPEVLAGYALLTAFKWAEHWSELSYSLWQVKKDLLKLSRLQSYKYIFLSGLLLLSFVWPGIKPLAFYAIIAGLCLIWTFIEARLSGLWSIKMTSLGSISVLKITFGLSVSSVFTALLVNLPRYQLKHFHGTESVGLFSALFYFYVIPSMVINFTCMSVLKEMGQRLNKKKFLMIIGMMILAGMLLKLLLDQKGSELLSSLYSLEIEWKNGVSLPLSLCLITGGLASVLHYYLMSIQIFQVQVWTNLVSCLCTLATGFLIIPKTSISGAFYALLSGLLVQFFIYFLIVLKRIR